LLLIAAVALLLGCASERKMVITVASSLPDTAIAKIGADSVNAETLCALIEKEKAEASHKGVRATIVLKVDPQALYSQLENVLECCGAREVESVTIADDHSTYAVHIRSEKAEMKEPYIFVTLAMPDGLSNIVAGIREITPGAVGTDQVPSVVQDFDDVRGILARAKERLIKQEAKTFSVLIDSRPDVTISKVLTVLSICEKVGLTPEFIAPRW
jgi:hypothetical protein